VPRQACCNRHRLRGSTAGKCHFDQRAASKGFDQRVDKSLLCLKKVRSMLIVSVSSLGSGHRDTRQGVGSKPKKPRNI
jgi:hypothetical protein